MKMQVQTYLEISWRTWGTLHVFWVALKMESTVNTDHWGQSQQNKLKQMQINLHSSSLNQCSVISLHFASLRVQIRCQTQSNDPISY